MKTAYTYTILRYVHDVAAGEALNVGIVLFAPAIRYLGARLQPNFGRLRKAFPALDGDAHRDLMRYLQRRFDKLQEELTTEFPFESHPSDARVAAVRVLPKDDSSLQWSPLGSGLSEDPEAELNGLYTRLVTANDGPKAAAGRADDAVWSIYRGPLAQEKVLSHLVPHKVIAENDEKEFEHAWKNSKWHCLEPLSLDLLDAESIRNKAHRLLGQMYGVREGLRNHILYLMVGEPQLEKCKPAGERVLNLLRNDLPIPNVIVREGEAAEFSRAFARKIDEHASEDQRETRVERSNE